MARQDQFNSQQRAQRLERGAIGIPIACTILLAVVGIGAVATDVSHNTTVRSELQNAADAAALAGAKALVSPQTSRNAEQYALDVAAINRADGKTVSMENSTVLVQIDTALSGEVGSCKVAATRTIKNWFAGIFGRPTDTISVTSQADASTSVSTVDSGILFPLAVSLDAVPTKGKNSDTLAAATQFKGAKVAYAKDSHNGLLDFLFSAAFAKQDDTSSGSSSSSGSGGNNGNGNGNGSSGSNGNGNDISYSALKDLKVGDTVHLVINSDKIDNSGWTSFTEKNTNSNWLHGCVDQNLGLTDPSDEYTVPSVTIGDPIYLTNGVKGFKDFGRDPVKMAALKAKPVVYLPVIEGDKFNQTSPLVGWVAVKVNNTYINNQTGCVQEFECTILKSPVRGKKGDIAPLNIGNETARQTLRDISPSAVRLVSSN